VSRKSSRPFESEPDELRYSGAPEPQRLAVSRSGMVASQHYKASEAGASILSQGGNAVDAAVGTALALSVCEPNASGLGGQTFMIVHISKTRRTFVLDGSSCAPHRVVPGTIASDDRRRGYKSATVPSTPIALSYALQKYGSMSFTRVVEPAIDLAEDGFEVTELYNRLLKRTIKHLRNGTARNLFLKNGRNAYRTGDIFRQPALANTLKRLVSHGVDDFYIGHIARIIQRDMIANGGLIRRDDLAQMGRPIERRPVSCWFGDTRIMTVPPPGGGRSLIEMLNIMSNLPKRYRRLGTPESATVISKVMQQAYRDRSDRPYDPNYYAQASKTKMLSMDYAKRLAGRIRSHGETTHLSVMDRFGNAVGLTQSIERVFGSCCASEELGFLYNNYLMAYEHEDMSHPYYLRPAAVPWASVAPTIAFKGRKPWLVVGSPGSERITASIFQVLLRLSYQSPFEAVDAPRLYCNLDGKVSIESSRMRDDIPSTLERHGFEIDRREPYSFYMGCVQLVMRENDYYTGVADPRRDGSANGPKP
jgi:gamma-glutamyltranspeptidase/glutathione hydrolase